MGMREGYQVALEGAPGALWAAPGGGNNNKRAQLWYALRSCRVQESRVSQWGVAVRYSSTAEAEPSMIQMLVMRASIDQHWPGQQLSDKSPAAATEFFEAQVVARQQPQQAEQQ